jgi:cytochrome c biogenesis protein CcdA/thiol-disulfide isomerase/thioredoxin
VLVLAFLGGVLTILSPCILPVIPLVFARAGRSFSRDVLPMLAGLAFAFTGAAIIATATAHWLLVANEIGRYVALLLLALVGVTLLSARASEWLTRPAARAGASLLGGPGTAAESPARNIVIGVAIGLLWAPCAGPILGLLIAGAAVSGSPRAAALFFTFGIGAAMSLAVVLTAGGKIISRVKRAGAADSYVRRALGAATLATVVAIFFGWDRALFAGGGLVGTVHAEERLVGRLAPGAVSHANAGMSLDAFAADESTRNAPIELGVMDGALPGFDGATEWLNSPALTPASLRGKVVLVDFWTFACYNCLNALPHVKELYAKYKDRGLVVIGVHTPELAHERVLSNVRSEVKRLGIEYPVVIDNDYRIWRAFHNQYWPAAYYADANGTLRFYHFGEGRYEEQDKVVARLLAERDTSLPSGGE